jgi:hypothetical protein
MRAGHGQGCPRWLPLFEQSGLPSGGKQLRGSGGEEDRVGAWDGCKWINDGGGEEHCGCGLEQKLRPEGVGTHGGNTGMELQGAELQVLTCDGPAGRAGNEGEGAFNTMHERVSREQIEDFFGCSGVECGAGASSGGCAIQTFGEGRHNKVVLTKGSCGFAALLLDRLVEGHETISNVYFAAGLDDRLRYICLCGGVQEDQLPE